MIRSTLLLCMLTAPLYALQEQSDIRDDMPQEFRQQAYRMQMLKALEWIKKSSQFVKSTSPWYDSASYVMFNYAPSEQYITDITHYLRTAPIPHSDDGQVFKDTLPRVLVAPLIFAMRRSNAVIALITEDPLIKHFSAQERAENNAKLDRLRIHGNYAADQSVQEIALTEIKEAQEYASFLSSKVKEVIKQYEDDRHKAFTWAHAQLSHVYGSEDATPADDEAGKNEASYKARGAQIISTAAAIKNALAQETHTHLLLHVLHECARVQEVATHAQLLLEKEIAQQAARPAERRKTRIKFVGMLAGAFLAPALHSYFASEDTTDITDCACPGNTPGVILSAAHLLPTAQDATDREQLPHTAAAIEQLKALRLKLP